MSNREQSRRCTWCNAGGTNRPSILTAAAALLLLVATPAAAFFANISVSPDPNTGDYTVSWNGGYTRTLQELPPGGAWTTIATTTSGSWDFSGRAPGDYSYRVFFWQQYCTGWPEPECYYYPNYSEVATVTVNAPPTPAPGPGGEDPFPAPGTFTPPNDADFPDATAVPTYGPTGDIVGALQGKGGVSGGQASYSIPVEVPPGRKGMQPSVSLNYSSSSGNGIAGVGWGLGGISSISRCAATAAQDGFTAAVQYDAARDRLCLDGRRLMVVNGSYGANGAEYRTELDSFARIRQYGSINGGTTYFIVEYKNGRVSKFGSTANTRHKASGRNEVLTWAIRETRDRSGNTISYIYHDYGNGEFPLSTIHYTGVNGSDGDRHVYFTYELRPDVRTAFLAGGSSRSTRRLKRIRVQYQSTTIRDYNLSYTSSLSTERSLLTSVQDCAYKNGYAYCLPSTTFEWQHAAPQYVTEKLQFADPNNLISGPPGTEPGFEVVHQDKRWLHDVLPHGDQNGDGVKDWANYQVNAEGKVTGTHSYYLSNCIRPANSFAYTCLEADFDADGRTDSFRHYNGKLQIRLASAGFWMNTGVNWATSSQPETEDTPLGFADFNGDGWVDLAMKQSSQLWIYFHTQNVSSPYQTSSRQFLLNYPPGSAPGTHALTASINGDMDGNGTPDFVVSNLPLSGQTPGLPRPSYILLTHSQPGGSMTTTTRGISGLINTVNYNSHFFHDVNGDGLADLLAISGIGFSGGQLVGSLKYRLNNGSDFVGAWTNLGMAIPVRHGEYLLQFGEPEDYYMPIMSKVLTMDYDGNGIAELLVADSEGANGVIASGCAEIMEYIGGVPTANWYCDDDLYGNYDPVKFSPVGTQMNSSVKDDSVRSYTAYRFDEDLNQNIVTSSFPSGIVASASQTAAIDATGDGLTDVVTVFGCRMSSQFCEFNADTAGRGGTVNGTYVAGAWINRNRGTATGSQRYQGYDLMSGVEDGLGNRNEWTYRPLSSDEYDKSNSDFYETDHSYQASDYDYFHFTSSMNVVADHRASNGVGGLNSTKYRYRGAIFNNKGRGFQGFRSIIIEEDVYPAGHAQAGTDKITRTDFYQKWPLSSQVEQACTFPATDGVLDDNPNCTNVFSKTTTNAIHNAATSGGARFVAVSNQTTRVYDLATHALLTTQTTQRSFDGAGNVTYQSNLHTDAWTTNETETSSTYAVDWTNWWLNRLTSKTVTHNPVSNRQPSGLPITGGMDNLKQVTTTISEYELTQRLPEVVTTTANDSSLSSTVTTAYNAYGLPTSVETTGTDVSGPRTVTMTYSKNGTTQAADGYFPYTLTNSLGHETEQHTDPAFGRPTSQWDANGLLTTTAYDAFGRPSDVTPPGQPTARQRYFWCDGGMGCPPGAAFVIKTWRAGAPESHSYVDAFGREVQSSVRNFADTSFVNVSLSYDERGNKTFTSVPYDPAAGESSSIGTRFLSYDALGRLTSKEVDQADGTVFLTNYVYDGLKTTINAGGLNMHRIYNGLKQLVETLDAEGGYTRYAYDGAGNPILLRDPRNKDITAAYNALGHKQWVDDPNMGLKSFTYNAAGEVLSELDANGDEVSMAYDELGRLIYRYVNGEMDGAWHYDGTGTYKGLGLLDYEDSQFRDDGTRLQKFYYYAPAASGRKDLLQVTHRFYRNDDQYDFTDYHTAYFTDGYYARPKGLSYPGGTDLAYGYNSAGYVIQEKDPATGYVYRQINARDSRNEVTAASLTNGSLSHTAEYYDATGQMKSIVVAGAAGTVHDLYYEYDTFGNLELQRIGHAGGTSTETFLYDDLHRLVQSQRSLPGGSATVNYAYDASGNLTAKSDYASAYYYNGSKPNAVTSISKAGGGTATFTYDANGNRLTGDGKTLTYTAFNKPATITAGGVTASFSYGADGMRYRQHKSNGETTLYLDKLMEIVTVGSTTDYRHYLSDVAILTKTGSLNDPSPAITFLHRDRLGSLATITSGSGSAQARGFDPFGKPRNGNASDRSPPTLGSTITERGFTEHEHLDESQLIHMNGRVYDYNLGRFLSVDPVIQAPGNSQSLNPYSYILNNPLSGTDPSGYCSTTDAIDACADSLDAGLAQEITDTDGNVVGHVGKDSDGNLYVTNNGSEAGNRAVQSAINANDRANSSMDGFGSQEQISSNDLYGSPDHAGQLRQEYEGKSFLGKLGERLGNFGRTDADVAEAHYESLLRLAEFCVPSCNFDYLNIDTVGLYSQYMAAPASLQTGGLAASYVGASQGFASVVRSTRAVPNGQYYSVAYEMRLSSRSFPGISRQRHFQEANDDLLRAMDRDPSFARVINRLGVELQRTPRGLAPRTSPRGWTWHHHPTEEGVMQLVPYQQHKPGSIFQNALHPDGIGGFSKWGSN